MAIEVWVPIITTFIGAAATLVAIRYKHKLTQRRIDSEADHECPIGACVSEDILVIEKLRSVLSEINADRISIMSFHNGGTFYSGKSMQKMSASYEECDAGISNTMIDRQNLPVSACITTLQPLMENGEFFCIDTKTYPEGLFKHHLLNDGVKSTYQYPIIDLHDNAIAVLCVDFVKRKTKLSDNDNVLLKSLATQLPGYLEGVKK